MDELEAADVVVLDILEFLTKHDRARGAIAVEQRERAVRLGQQRRLDDAEHRGNAAAAGKGDVMLFVRRIQGNKEASHRRHDVQNVAGRDLLVSPAGKPPVGDLLDADAQVGILDGGADRVASTHLFAVDLGAKGQVLTLLKSKRFLMLCRHVERQHNRVTRFMTHARYC